MVAEILEQFNLNINFVYLIWKHPSLIVDMKQELTDRDLTDHIHGAYLSSFSSWKF